MSTQDLTDMAPGDKIVFGHPRQSWEHVPVVSHEIFTITKVTAAQIVAKNQRGAEARVWRVGGRKVGTGYTFATRATPEILATHTAQVAELSRWHAANEATKDLIDKPLHQLKLTTDQLERLAAAWAEIKTLGAA